MKKVILLALLMPCIAIGQIVENFESGDLSTWSQSPDGHWSTDTLDAISGSLSLHHSFDNSDSGTDRIGLAISDLHPSEGLTKWSFHVRHGYDPSSSNNWSVFLMSDSEPSGISPSNGTKGFAVGVNLSGYDDTLRLWKVNDGILSTIVNTGMNWQKSIGTAAAAKIVIERSAVGNWTVSVYMSDGSLLSESYGVDSELFNSDWLCVYYRYTSTRDRLLWFDDLNINGIIYKDKTAPEVLNCKAIGKNSINIVFNEKPADKSLNPENFSLNGLENGVVSVVRRNDRTYSVYFESDLINKFTNILVINSLCDDSGNCMENISVEVTLILPEPGDVIISEIMADPLPAVSLPGKEYLEIYNRTDFVFNLKNWVLRSEDQKWIFPEEIIEPKEIAIVCSSKDTVSFRDYGRVIGLLQFPVLTDGGRMLCLEDSSGNLIHGLEYTSEWYSEELKSRGGWSLEMIDSDFPFYYEGNWGASKSKTGGSPGEINSVSHSNPDYQFYGLMNVFPGDSAIINVKFSEPVFNLEDHLRSISINNIEIGSIVPVDPLLREFRIIPGETLKRSIDYELVVSGAISDFPGNRPEVSKFIFGLPEQSEPGDVLFNELLFNPMPGDPDFLELYNRSDKIIDVSRLQLISISSSTGDTSQLYPISNERRCLLPKMYYCVTTDRDMVIQRYFSSDPGNLFETESLVAMSDKEGHLVLLNRELERIDEVVYNEDMHYPLLAGAEGVSLEKSGPDNKSEEALNWHSASESSGWGTPGAVNSIFFELPQSHDELSFSTTRISPDSDGFEDFLTMRINLAGIGNVVSINIFDESGSYMKNIATNMFIGSEASFIWDGTSDDGSPVRNGIYIVLVTSFDYAGKTNRWKKVCTVIRN